MTYYLILFIGILAQLFFSARLLVQWIASEKAHKVLAPTLYWELSMAGAILLCLYGWLRNDFSIILGQFITYYIYIWNIDAKGLWKKLSKMVRGVVIMIPLLAFGYVILNFDDANIKLFQNKDIPVWLIIFGSIGQSIFTLRFIYQWWYSRKEGECSLPLLFWVISIIGSGLIICYAIIRQDTVLILGQTAGFIIYARNILIEYRYKLLK